MYYSISKIVHNLYRFTKIDYEVGLIVTLFHSFKTSRKQKKLRKKNILFSPYEVEEFLIFLECGLVMKEYSINHAIHYRILFQKWLQENKELLTYKL